MTSIHISRYANGRRIVVLGGTMLLVGIAALAWAHGVDPVESLGVVLYVPVFLAAILAGPWEGSAVGLVSAAAYVGLRIPAIRVVGFTGFAGVLVPRVASYVFFGAVIGFAAHRLNASLSHLERHDLVDEATGLHNARWLLEATDAEINRVERATDPVRGFLGYGSVFSVAMVRVAAETFRGREGSRLLAGIGAEMGRGLRRSDRPVHALNAEHLFAVLLPGTASLGAAIVEARTLERINGLLGEAASGRVTSSALTYPGDEETLAELREQLKRIDTAQRLPDVV